MSKRLLVDASDATDDANERRKRVAMDDAVGQLCCPITTSLPVDPVTAEDGKVYERDAIVRWLTEHKRSPLTNEPMGGRLLPAHQVRGMIRSMVEAGALTGDKVDAWQQKLEEEEQVKELTRKASAGDVDAMHDVGKNYHRGQNGFDKDHAKAFQWFEKAHLAGSASATAHLGGCYIYGEGVPKCTVRAHTLLADAAARGHGPACWVLGDMYARAIFGCPKDEKMARYYFNMVRRKTSGWKDGEIMEAHRRKVDEWLREHPPPSDPVYYASRAAVPVDKR